MDCTLNGEGFESSAYRGAMSTSDQKMIKLMRDDNERFVSLIVSGRIVEDGNRNEYRWGDSIFYGEDLDKLDPRFAGASRDKLLENYILGVPIRVSSEDFAESHRIENGGGLHSGM
jgi:hypothetical protein